MNLPPEEIEKIAREEAHNVAPTGSPAAEEHNTRTIIHAINRALEKAQSLEEK